MGDRPPVRAPAGGRFRSTVWGFRAPGWGEQPPVRGAFKGPVWGIQAPNVGIWAGSGFLTPVQRCRSPSAAPRTSPARSPQSWPIPTLGSQPPAWELMGLGLSPLVPSDGGAEDPHSLGWQGEPCQDPQRANGRYRGGMCKIVLPLALPRLDSPNPLLRILRSPTPKLEV